ncbi:MAG: glycerate kinase [Acetatifactor sp.]|nr:glycerate kinase [Acetatifactor sp.]
MKILVAMDSFKGSLNSREANGAVNDGIKKACPTAYVLQYQIADGGEGTVEALLQKQDYERITVKVTDPLGRKVNAQYCIISEKKTAVMEMSQAAGLTLLKENERNPIYTTTFGVGEMIRDAIGRGILDFVIGIGGSATNDAGIGMLQALGYEFKDENGKEVGFGSDGLSKVKSIRNDRVIPEIYDCQFRVACDVSNPLYGKQGCSMVFGRQKGAGPDLTYKMDAWMQQYAAVVKTILPHADADYPGAGAAGGLGYAFHTFLNAELVSGISLVLEWSGIEEAVRQADIVITGEGKLDAQTLMGKTPFGVAQIAKKFGKPVIALAGAVGSDTETLNDNGIDAFFPIVDCARTLEEAMDKTVAYENLKRTAEQVMRLIGRRE